MIPLFCHVLPTFLSDFNVTSTSGYRAAANTVLHGSTEISQVCELLSSVGWNASNASSIHHDSPWFTVIHLSPRSKAVELMLRQGQDSVESASKKTQKQKAGATGLEACLEAWEKMHLQCCSWKTEGWEENAIIYIYILYYIIYIYICLLYDIYIYIHIYIFIVCKQIDITRI